MSARQEKPGTANSGRHFIQYHNPDRMGGPYAGADGFSILTDKPFSLLAALPGNTVWLIGGEGRPRSYGLCCVFLVDAIGESGHPGFRWRARGTTGRHFVPPLRIDHDPWFPGFLWRQANFSLGLRALGDADVAHLRRLSGISDLAP